MKNLMEGIWLSVSMENNEHIGQCNKPPCLVEKGRVEASLPVEPAKGEVTVLTPTDPTVYARKKEPLPVKVLVVEILSSKYNACSIIEEHVDSSHGAHSS